MQGETPNPRLDNINMYTAEIFLINYRKTSPWCMETVLLLKDTKRSKDLRLSYKRKLYYLYFC